MYSYNEEYKISPHSYRELYHYCLRYPHEFKNKKEKDCELIEQTAMETDNALYKPLLYNVTSGVSYDQMKAMGIEIFCGKNQFYDKRQKFFYLLNKRKYE